MTFPIHIFLKNLSWKHTCKSLNRSGRNLESFFRYLRQDSVSSVKGESTFRSNAGTTSAFTGMPVSPTECADVEFDQYITLDFTTWLRSADGIRSTSIMSTWDVLRHLIPYSSLDWLDKLRIHPSSHHYHAHGQNCHLRTLCHYATNRINNVWSIRWIENSLRG